MEIIELIINAAQESFLHVGVLLGIVILIFAYIDYKTEGKLINILERNTKAQPIIGALFGIIPGCGGSIILIPLYTKNKVSFGTLVATLISSMGDGSFILMSTDIKAYLGVSVVSFIIAIISGYTVDMLNIDKKLKLRKNKIETYYGSHYEINQSLYRKEKEEKSKLGHKFTHSIGYKVYYVLIIIGFIFTLVSGRGLEHAHEHIHEHELVLSFESVISILGVSLSIMYMVLSKRYIKNSTHEVVEGKILSFKEMVIHSANETAFVITWIFIGYLVYDIGVLIVGGEEVANAMLLSSGVVSVIVGAMLGIVPGCGTQVIFISLYTRGVIPFAALVANSISQDGDALFPLIALDKKSALWATILTTIPAIIVGLGVYMIMN
ncbi:MAG: putative manganese transporter [Romboutsia sp.]